MAYLKAKTQEEFEHRLLHGLACEWEAAVCVLDCDERKRLQKPLIRIDDLNNRWGYWSGVKKELGLSRELVLNHGWDSVKEVLLHEIAHQYTEQVLKAVDEPPHGPSFQLACERLRANPAASGNYPPLRKRIAGEAMDHNHKMLRRIQKLFSLAQSSHPHEAEAAMLKAHELITKYNVDLYKEDSRRGFFSIFIGRPALRHRREEYHLAHLLQDYYFVYGLWVSAYVPEKGRMGHVLEISGTSQNIRLAEYVYHFVQNYIHYQWASFNAGKRLNRYRQTDFAVGIIEGFRSRLDGFKALSPAQPGSKAPMVVQDPRLKAYLSYRYPRTVTHRYTVINQDKKVWNAGIKAGKKLVIYKGITERAGSIKLLE